VIESLAVGVLAVVIYLVLTRHYHRWTAWTDPKDQPTGNPTQHKWCKDRACNIYKIRRINP